MPEPVIDDREYILNLSLTRHSFPQLALQTFGQSFDGPPLAAGELPHVADRPFSRELCDSDLLLSATADPRRIVVMRRFGVRFFRRTLNLGAVGERRTILPNRAFAANGHARLANHAP